eukprot:14968200-Ditylum_brightwellii.AAC.1
MGPDEIHSTRIATELCRMILTRKHIDLVRRQTLMDYDGHAWGKINQQTANWIKISFSTASESNVPKPGVSARLRKCGIRAILPAACDGTLRIMIPHLCSRAWPLVAASKQNSQYMIPCLLQAKSAMYQYQQYLFHNELKTS